MTENIGKRLNILLVGNGEDDLGAVRRFSEELRGGNVLYAASIHDALPALKSAHGAILSSAAPQYPGNNSDSKLREKAFNGLRLKLRGAGIPIAMVGPEYTSYVLLGAYAFLKTRIHFTH